MAIAEFELIRPRTVDAAVEALARFGPEAQMVAGGTDLYPSMKQGLFAPRVLVDLKALRELDGVRSDTNGRITLGALTRISSLAESRELAARFPVLAEAARVIASPL